MNEKLHWLHFQLDRSGAIIHLPDVYQNMAHMVWEDKVAKKRG